jgi:glucose-6-phosphate 1-dehydrogenase
MDFRYGTAFGHESPEAYERLLLDTMRGDATLFTRHDEVEAQWAFVDPILSAWEKNEVPLATYEAGSWGPKEAHELLEKSGFSWSKP